MPSISLYIDSALYKKVQDAAETEGEGESKIFQQILKEYFEKQKDQKIFNIPTSKWVNLSDEEQKNSIEKFYNKYYKNRDDCFEHDDKM